jgi:hypothetical protein
MACNCATQEQIEQIINKYGPKAPKDKKAPLKQKVKSYAEYIGVVICMAFIVPVLVIYVGYKVFFAKDNRISLRKFFNLPKNADENIAETLG